MTREDLWAVIQTAKADVDALYSAKEAIRVLPGDDNYPAYYKAVVAMDAAFDTSQRLKEVWGFCFQTRCPHWCHPCRHLDNSLAEQCSLAHENATRTVTPGMKEGSK